MKRKLKDFLEAFREVGFVVCGIAFIAVIAALMVLGVWHLFGLIFRPADVALPAEDPAEGAGMRTETVGAIVALTGTGADWFAPEEAETVYQESNARVTHGDALDYNINTTLWGWDGHGAEVWEIDLFSRVFYLEFWQPNVMLCEAGCDAMLNLWASGIYGDTLFECLSYYDPEYGYTYRVYPRVWETVYDADGLAWCREFCENRFYNGPVWCAEYFRLGGYHDPAWVTPAYQIDNVYFSVRGW